MKKSFKDRKMGTINEIVSILRFKYIMLTMSVNLKYLRMSVK